MKKFLSLLLVAAMLLTLAPTVMFAAETGATQKVKLYDVHITGNVVVGGTLTANFEPADADAAQACGLDIAETIKTIKWYARNRYSNRNTTNFKTLDITGKKEYTITTDPSLTAHGVFFTVTPKDKNGNSIGDTVVSTQTFNAASINADATEPSARNAVIVPQNGEGLMSVGKTVAARFTFRYPKSASIGNGNSLYEWYTSDTLLSDDEMSAATIVQAESTNPFYTIKTADAGKWLYVKITPVASDNAIGTAVYSHNHIDNQFLRSTAKDFGLSNFEKSTYYPHVRSLADGCYPSTGTNAQNMSTFLYSNGNTADVVRCVIIDAGEVVPFDHAYLKNINANIKTLKIGYSAQEDLASKDDIEWDYAVNSSGLTLTGGEREFDFGEILYGRYFKLEYTHVTNYSIIEEFYPFLVEEPPVIVEPATIDYTIPRFAKLKDGVINVKAWGTPLSELTSATNGLTITTELDEEGSTENAEKIRAAIKFVTKTGETYTDIETPENIKITENTNNVFMVVDGINYEVRYSGHLVEKEADVEEEIVGSSHSSLTRYPVDEVYFPYFDSTTGYATGKYLLKTQIYLPYEYRVTLAIKQGGPAMSTNSNIPNVVFFMGNETPYNGQGAWAHTYNYRNIGVPNGGNYSGYNYSPNKWYDLEVLLDYDKLDVVNKTISISIWVDGIRVYDKLTIKWVDPSTNSGAKNRISPLFTTYPNQGSTGVKTKNSSFRQVWSADTNVVENNYDIKLVNTNNANASATAITAGNYTTNCNLNVFNTGDYRVHYIAKYYVDGTSTELVEVKAVTDMAQDYIEVTQEEIDSKSVVLKAISLVVSDNNLYPNFVSVKITE